MQAHAIGVDFFEARLGERQRPRADRRDLVDSAYLRCEHGHLTGGRGPPPTRVARRGPEILLGAEPNSDTAAAIGRPSSLGVDAGAKASLGGIEQSARSQRDDAGHRGARQRPAQDGEPCPDDDPPARGGAIEVRRTQESVPSRAGQPPRRHTSATKSEVATNPAP